MQHLRCSSIRSAVAFADIATISSCSGISHALLIVAMAVALDSTRKVQAVVARKRREGKEEKTELVVVVQWQE